MATDPKVAPLADELKELALSLPTSVFPKAFFCALCSELAIDSYKLLCCNKAICTTCQAKLSFPTTCPSCDHSPLEADSCTPNKSLRNTMRIWLQKQKKKEEAKAAAQVATPVVEMTPAATEAPSEVESADKPIDSVEEATVTGSVVAEPATAATDAGDGEKRTVSVSAQPNEDSTAAENIDPERCGSMVSQAATQGVEPSVANASSGEQNGVNGPASMMGNNPMMNGMQGQMGFGFQNQGNFGGMGFNGMSNMMSNASWNNMNPMEYNMNNMNGMSNGMYGGFGGNMGMGMNDMSAMNMMNYGGGYGNGWNGMGGGYGNFNGFNQMGGYNQSGAYPEMMNQFPKNNFQNQNQNRFPANQGGPLPNNRTGSQRGSISGLGSQQNANSRPGSRSGPAQNVRQIHNRLLRQPLSLKLATDENGAQQRDGESGNASADAGTETNPEGEQDAVVKSTEGNENDGSAQDTATVTNATNATGQVGSGTGDASKAAGTGDQANESAHSNGLSQIQTIDTEDDGMQGYDQSMMGNGMQPDMGYANGMMNQFSNQMQMNAPFDPSMNMGFHQNHNFGPRSGFNAAYGAATILTGEPQGRGVEGAPTGPRAMREGRPNTGFSSRMNNVRYQPPPKSVTPAQSTGARSPQRRVRSRSPLRDENLRTKDKSASRSRSRSQVKDDETDDRHERSRSADRKSRREGRGRSATPQADNDLESRKDRKHHRSSRYEDREYEHEDRYRDDKASRGDRTRSASADSKYRSSRRDKEKHRSSRSHRDRSKEHRRRHRSRSRSPREEDKFDDDGYANGDRESESGSRRKHRSEKDKRDRSRDKDRERDRRDRKDREKDYDYEYDREKDRSKEKDKERRRRRDREAEEDGRDYDDDKHRSSRRSRKDRDRDERSREDRDGKSKRPVEDDVVGKMMQKRAVSPPLNAPTGPSANTFSIKGAGRTKSSVMPPPQPPSGPRGFQPPKGPAADRDKDKNRGLSSVSSVPPTPVTPAEPTSQDHYAAEREKNARERNSRDRVDRDQRDVLTKSLHSRVHSSSRPSLSSKRSRDDIEDVEDAPRGPNKGEVKAPTGPASHRDKRRKSGAGGDNSIASLFTAGLRKNAGKTRRGGVRTEGDVEREMERVERERDRR